MGARINISVSVRDDATETVLSQHVGSVSMDAADPALMAALGDVDTLEITADEMEDDVLDSMATDGNGRGYLEHAVEVARDPSRTSWPGGFIPSNKFALVALNASY